MSSSIPYPISNLPMDQQTPGPNSSSGPGTSAAPILLQPATLHQCAIQPPYHFKTHQQPIQINSQAPGPHEDQLSQLRHTQRVHNYGVRDSGSAEVLDGPADVSSGPIILATINPTFLRHPLLASSSNIPTDNQHPPAGEAENDPNVISNV